jgi:hypothetical protein
MGAAVGAAVGAARIGVSAVGVETLDPVESVGVAAAESDAGASVAPAAASVAVGAAGTLPLFDLPG